MESTPSLRTVFKLKLQLTWTDSTYKISDATIMVVTSMSHYHSKKKERNTIVDTKFGLAAKENFTSVL